MRLRKCEVRSKDQILQVVGRHKISGQLSNEKEKPPAVNDERPLVFTTGKRPSILRTTERPRRIAGFVETRREPAEVDPVDVSIVVEVKRGLVI